LTLYYDVANLQQFRSGLVKIEQLRLIVPNLQVANIELIESKIKVTLCFDKKYRDFVVTTFGVEGE
ncbi:hypothetical protein, partial [Thermococcus sp. ES12]